MLTFEDKMKLNEVAVHVRRAVKFLDADLVDMNWRDQVNFETLDLDNMSNCILGQLYGHFDKAPEDARFMLAFCADVDLKNPHEFFRDYTAAWLTAITLTR